VSTRLTVFVSSTVRDFGPVRRDIRSWLKKRGIDVRESEDPEFPVDPAVHSHDACLRAIEGTHLFILLVGWRYGGLYRGTRQSITWREYDEARRLGIPVLAFILKDVAVESMRIAQAKRALEVNPSKLDPGVFRFIDAIRRVSYDNWIHEEWDGSLTYLRRAVDSRIGALFVSYQKPHREIEHLALRMVPYALARQQLDEAIWQGQAELGGRELLDKVLAVATTYRAQLFDFEPDDRWNFVVHKRDGDLLRVYSRRHHPEIITRDRSWPIGEGHVGLAARGELLVSPKLQAVEGWRSQYPSDEEYYVSGISAPIYPRRDPEAEPIGVLTITSDRPDHFRFKEQVEVLTAQSLASILSMIGVLD
jgi:hypothetical protein